MSKRHYRTFREVEAEYLKDHPAVIEAYLSELFEAYASGHDSAALLASLRVIAKVRGITVLAKKTGLTRQGLQHALSSKGNPRFDNINAIINALGYKLMPEKFNHDRRV